MNEVVKALSIFLLSLFFLGILVFSFFFQFTKIENISLKVNPQLKDSHFTETIQKKINLKLNDYKGKKIWKVKLENIATDIKKIYPALKIQVTRKLPNRIIVFLQNKDSVALLLKDNGGLYPVSFQGELQTRPSLNQSLDLPILTGKFFEKNKALRKKAIKLLLRFPEKGLLISKNVSEVIYNKKNSSFLFVLIPNYLVLELLEDLSSHRIKNINFVLNYLIQKGVKGSRVDVRFDKKIIVNARNSL